jgi:hypothetical protein
VEGETDNDPLKARTAILEALATLPEGSWWSLSSFISSIHQGNPDFQRTAGDYDSWFVKDLSTGEYLRGFTHWDEVEGELIRFLIGGPLHWLGLMDLAYPSEERTQPSAFRLNPWAKDLLHGNQPSGLANEDQMLFIRTDGVVVGPRLSPRVTRYQLARFCYWEGYDGENYRYRLTPQSLSLAKNQGLRVQHLMGLLRRSTKNIPPALLKSLERWEQKGSEATIQPVTILRLSSPELLQTLRNSPVARLLGEPLGPTAVIVKPRNIKKILSALADLGYLGEVEDGMLDQFVKKDLPSEVKNSPE